MWFEDNSDAGRDDTVELYQNCNDYGDLDSDGPGDDDDDLPCKAKICNLHNMVVPD